jgi:protein-export membrane protein SecD
LPVPISLISTQTVGPSLGADAVNGGLLSGIIAFVIIAIFLIVWYRLPGLVAVVALAAYTIFMLAIFKLLPVTLTAAGIAGFILSIGMAVDANILIFERMKEELLRGRGTWDAMHEGFLRAWTSIRDSNISSIITAIILYFLGSTSVVIGFATVFFFGVVISMITAISVSRLFLYAIVPTKDSRISRFLISNGFRNRNK